MLLFKNFVYGVEFIVKFTLKFQVQKFPVISEN